MSFVDRLIEEQNAYDQAAENILIEAETLQRCENHEHVMFSGDADIAAAKALAAEQLREGAYKMDSKELMKAIDRVYTDHCFAESCPVCDDNMNEYDEEN